jgi:hypothetical protein
MEVRRPVRVTELPFAGESRQKRPDHRFPPSKDPKFSIAVMAQSPSPDKLPIKTSPVWLRVIRTIDTHDAVDGLDAPELVMVIGPQ